MPGYAERVFAALGRFQGNLTEFTDLATPERRLCMALVCGVERVLREQLAPTKINLASLGNVTPHLHWHVIARFDWDSHFPQPVWGERQQVKVRLIEIDAPHPQPVTAVAQRAVFRQGRED